MPGKKKFLVTRGMSWSCSPPHPVHITIPDRKPNVTCSGLPPKTCRFFHGPRAAFPQNIVNNGPVVFANKQTNADENITSLAEVTSGHLSIHNVENYFGHPKFSSTTYKWVWIDMNK